jgi:hypothetical protein
MMRETQTESLPLKEARESLMKFDFNPNYILKKNFNHYQKPAAIFD